MRHLVSGWGVVLVVCAAAGLARAAEWSAKTTKHPAATSQTHKDEHPALSLEGAVTARYPYGKPQRLLVTAADGTAVTLMVDPARVSITNAEKPSSFEEVTEGDHVKIRYSEQNGQSWLTSLEVVPLPPSAVPSPEPTAPTPSSLPDESTR